MEATDSLTALSLIDAHAARDPEHRAVVFEDQSITYRQLYERSVLMARRFRAMGLTQGGRVCLYAANCPEVYLAYLATLRCGAALFPVNSDLARDEVVYIIEKSDPTFVLCDDSMVDRAQEAAGVTARSYRVMTFADVLGQTLAPDAGIGWMDVKRSPGDMALVVHTSGTTARPKGVIATDAMEIRSALALHAVWDIRPEDISVCALPLSYTFGLFSASYVALCAGATVLLLKKFNPVRVLEAIVATSATMMVGVPTMYAMMLEHVQQTGLRYDLSSIRMMAASGAPAAPQLKEDFQSTFGVILRDYYALSECTPIFSFDLRQAHSSPKGSVGGLVDGAQIRLLDDRGRAVADGEIGELRVRSERLMPAYYQDPQRTAEAIEGGWFKTRDLAYRDSDGNFFVVGRDRDQVISGGHKIASTEVESTIAQVPAVARVAVVGAPHPVLGEVVKAVVVLRQGQHCSAEAIVEYCEARLAAYKVPGIVEFRSELPISPAGKVLKRQLVA